VEVTHNPQIRAPALDELVSGIDAGGRRKNTDCAIILPFNGETGCVRAHLRLLEFQTEQDFDVILVSSSSPVLEKKPARTRYGTVSIKLKKPLGAGAFYVGQKYAFENGYRTIILADADALPAHRHLVGRLKTAVASDNSAIHIPKASSIRRGSPSRSIHWYGAMHSRALAKSGFTFLPLYFGGVDDELQARMQDAGIRIRYLDGVSVSHPLYKPMPLPAATARALNDIRNRAPQFYRFPPSLWPVMPIFSALSMFSFRDNAGRHEGRIGLASSALSSMVRGTIPCQHFTDASVRIQPYPACRLEDALSHENPAKAIALCMEVGDSGFPKFQDACKKRGIPCEMIFFEESGNPLSYSHNLLAGPFISGSVVVFSDWRLFFNPLLLLYRRAYLHDGKSTWLVADEGSLIKRAGSFILTTFSFMALAAAYFPASLISWLRVGKSRLRYGLE
jgi:hypothetical protein